MYDFFIEYMNYESLGRIDNSHLVMADINLELMAKDPKCLKLAELHAEAVDFNKTGYCPQIDKRLLSKIYPDFMEKKEKDYTYISESILGELYREVKTCVQR